MRKGITPVIAIILLLLITISMVGFAFVWFSRVQQISTEKTQTQLEEQLKQQAMTIRIDNALPISGTTVGTDVTVRNTGSVDIDGSKLAFFVKDVQANLVSGCATITVGTVQTCRINIECASGTDKVRVTAPGNQDVVTCK